MPPMMIDDKLAEQIEAIAAEEGRTVNEVLSAMIASYSADAFGIVFADPETEAADEALWQAKFKDHPEALDRLIAAAQAEIAAGEVEPFDPDQDDDLP